MKLFLKYLAQYRWSAAIFLLFSLIFASVFYLYDVQAEAVLYSCILCGVCMVIVIPLHFQKFRHRHLLLKNIYENLPLMAECMPDAENLLQEDFRRIAERLSQINHENVTRFNRDRQESVDYYTVWMHQIKTPIAAMQMLLQAEDVETNRELSAELFRIEQYAEMALYYLRLDSASSDFVIQNYDLDSIVREAVRRYASQFIRRKIRLVYEPVNVKVLTDKKWLLFIIEQLLSNAVKYAVKGEIAITYTENQVLQIADTGIGIAEEDIPRIFEKGFTGLSGRTERKSTGLGLYLCRKAADKLGHGLSVQSEIGKGTIFSIDLSTAKLEIE